jgi:tRNA nucleotidyltransferase (CCA-adding enzyme)
MPGVDTDALKGDLLLRGVWEGLGTPKCHLTGGYVRDRLLGRESVDLDLVLPGSLESAAGPARRLAARLDTRAHVLGRDANRVWRIETPKIKIELWSLGDLDLDQDIKRRDFSCNALVWNLPNGPLDDRINGAADLEGGLIRALAKKNLVDDPVRLVRAPRFLAQLEGFEIEAQTSRWIRELAPDCVNAPRERVGQELLKLLDAPAASAGIRALMDLWLLKPAAPIASRCDRRWLESHAEAASRLAGAATHPVPAAAREAGIAAQMALLLRGWGNPGANAVAAYAWPRTLRRSAARAAALLDQALETVDKPAAERRSFIHIAGMAFPVTMALAAAVEPDQPWARWWRLWSDRGRELVNPKPLLTSNEIEALMETGPGPALGRAIDALIEAQVRGEVKTAEGARRWLKKTFER